MKDDIPVFERQEDGTLAVDRPWPVELPVSVGVLSWAEARLGWTVEGLEALRLRFACVNGAACYRFAYIDRERLFAIFTIEPGSTYKPAEK
jgi:hypothetical protein